jgi:hypothetical protein
MSKADWSSDGLHPVAVMRRKDKHKPCERKDGNVEVEDHGNGYMFVGCSSRKQAVRILRTYIGKKAAKTYRFMGRTVYQMPYGWVCCVWLSAGAFEAWDGAEWMPDYPVER